MEKTFIVMFYFLLNVHLLTAQESDSDCPRYLNFFGRCECQNSFECPGWGECNFSFGCTKVHKSLGCNSGWAYSVFNRCTCRTNSDCKSTQKCENHTCSMSSGVIAGLVAGGFLFVALIIVATLCYRKHRTERQRDGCWTPTAHIVTTNSCAYPSGASAPVVDYPPSVTARGSPPPMYQGSAPPMYQQ